MLFKNPLRAMLVVAIGALVTLGACSDGGEELTGPPIAMLSGQVGGDEGGDVTTVAGAPLDAQCACGAWACSIATCGYDTATDPRGACCVSCAGTFPAAPKPSCDPGGGGGGGLCADEPGAGEWGVDFCVGGQGFQCESGNYCPSAYVCCYGGPHGNGSYGVE